LCEQAPRLAVKAQAQMMIGIVVADEVPLLCHTRFDDAMSGRLNDLAQHLIGSRRAAIKLGVKPLAAGRKETGGRGDGGMGRFILAPLPRRPVPRRSKNGTSNSCT